MPKPAKPPKLPTYWAPQEGPQTRAATSPIDETLYGGTRGGGKSDCAIGRQIRGSVKYGYRWNGIMFRRKYKELRELKRRFDELIIKGMPATRRGGDNQSNIIEFHTGPAKGAIITLTACENISSVDDWIGHQFTEITIDEAPQIPFIGLMIDKLKGSLRSPHGVPGHIFLTGNPGGPGASALKMMYIDPAPTGVVQRVIDTDPVTREEFTTTRVYIHSTLDDNKILVENDPSYKRRLYSIQDPTLRAAWTEGRWDIYIGQAFHFNPQHHVIQQPNEVWPIPPNVPIYMTFDYGFGAPFSFGWWWVDDQNRIYRFGEWYGWDGKVPNKGLRLTDPDIARGIYEHEKRLGILGRRIIRLSGRDCFNKKPNYMGGGQGPSTSDEFRAFAARGDVMAQYNTPADYLNMNPGDINRELKIRQFRNRLRIPDFGKPLIQIYESCREFIRTIPSLCLDEMNVEDLEDGQEDHIYDEACLVCMARPLSADFAEEQRLHNIQSNKERIQSLDPAARAASKELFVIRRGLLHQQSDILDTDELEKDPRFNPEVFGFDAELDVDSDLGELIQQNPDLRKLFFG